MNKARTTLSALAVAAAVSGAMAHTKSLFFYCVAYEQIEDPNEGVTTIPYAYNQWDYPSYHDGPCTLVVALTQSPFVFYTMYGYIKTTPPGVPCGGPRSCPAIRATQEF